MSFLGDIRVSQVLYFHFTTRQFSTGAPITSASLALSVYKDDSTTESTSGITTTFTSGFDGRVGLVSVKIDTSADGTFYAAGHDFSVVVTAGTADSVSIVGEVVGYFSIENRSALMPTTAARKLDVSAGGEAGVDWANVGGATTANDLTNTTIKTTQKVDVDTIKTNPVVNGGTITFPTTATLASTTNITAGTIATVTNLTNAPTAGDFTATMKTSIGTAVAASAVASVTGNVGGNVTGSVGSVVGAVGSVTGLTASDVGAIKAKTDQLTFTVSNRIDASAVLMRRPLFGYNSEPVNDLSASEDFLDSSWQNENLALLTPNAAIGPAGSIGAFELIEASDTGKQHDIFTFPPGIVATTQYATSIYAKAGTRTWLFLQAYNLTNDDNAGAYFNLGAGAVGSTSDAGMSIDSATIESVGGGWYRCNVVFTTGSGVQNVFVMACMASADTTNSYNGDGTSKLYLWGAQFETGGVSTAYRPVPYTIESLAEDSLLKLEDTLQVNGGSPSRYQFTADALELAPTGGSAPTAASIADAVWDEVLADHLTSGTTGAGLNGASSAGDPWATALPGAYGAGTAGQIVGDNIDAMISSRTKPADTQAAVTSVIGIAAGGIAAASFAAGAIDAAAIATDAIDADAIKTDAVTEIQSGLSTLNAAGVRTAVGLASANLDTQLAAVQSDTDDIQTRLPAALVSGRMDASVGAMAANVITATAINADAITDAKVAADVTIASVTGAVGSVTGAVGSVAGLTASDVGTIKAKTDQLAFSTANRVDSQVFGMQGGTVTASAVATDAIDADALAADALAEFADAIWDELLAGHAVSGSAGEALTASGAGGNPWTVVLEGSYTAQDLFRIMAAVMAGKTTIVPTTFGASVIFRDVTDASDIVSADMVGSERAAVTLAP